MGIILYILFLISCIFAGFNGMPYMFIFPIVTIMGVVIISKNYKNIDNSKCEKYEDNDDMQEMVLFP